MTYIFDNKKKKADHRSMIKKQAFRLAELLAQSPEYMQFVDARDRLAADDEQSSILADLRQQQLFIRMADIMGEEPPEEREDFNSLYATLSGNPVISDYLFAEGRLFHLIADVEEVFSDTLELAQDFDQGSPESNPLLN
jgi:cell fate (sporulation/competence/biofilm development) regulator YlbF (YheA/YmcA/DUF963 family)